MEAVPAPQDVADGLDQQAVPPSRHVLEAGHGRLEFRLAFLDRAVVQVPFDGLAVEVALRDEEIGVLRHLW